MTENMESLDKVLDTMDPEQRHLFAFALIGALSVITNSQAWESCVLSALAALHAHVVSIAAAKEEQ